MIGAPLMKACGVVSERCFDFGGWNYRVEVDRRGVPWRINGGAILCLIWPAGESMGTPLPARSVYLPPDLLERENDGETWQ